MLRLDLLLLGVLVLCVEGRSVQRRTLQQVPKDGEDIVYSKNVVVDVNTRQPVAYPSNSWKCVKFSVAAAAGENNNEPRPILAFLQSGQHREESIKGSLELGYLPGSNCTDKCTREVEIPVDRDGGRPFFVVLVNAVHIEPPFNPQQREELIVTVRASECSSDSTEKLIEGQQRKRKSSRSGAKIFPILFPILGVLLLAFVCIAFAAANRKKYRDEDSKSTSDRMAPLAGVRNRQGMDESPPQVQAVEDPFRYIPPSQGHMQSSLYETHSSKQVQASKGSFFSKLFAKGTSKPPPASEPTAERHVAAQRSQPVEESVEDSTPNPIYSVGDSAADENEGVQTESEPTGNAVKVFVNSMYHRARSGLQDSFRTFASFGDRNPRNSGVKLKSLTSAVQRGQGGQGSGAQADQDSSLPSGAVSPSRLEPHAEVSVDQLPPVTSAPSLAEMTESPFADAKYHT